MKLQIRLLDRDGLGLIVLLDQRLLLASSLSIKSSALKRLHPLHGLVIRLIKFLRRQRVRVSILLVDVFITCISMFDNLAQIPLSVLCRALRVLVGLILNFDELWAGIGRLGPVIR